MTKALRIRNWDDHYENNRSRELKRPEWLPLPNKFDGVGFMELMDHPAGMSHYGAWCLLLAAASRMPKRGSMVTDSGRAMSTKDIARMTRGSAKAFDEALPRLIAIGWVEEVDVDDVVTTEKTGTNADRSASGEDADGSTSAESPQPRAGIPQQGADLVRVKGNGNMNGKGKENAAPTSPPPSSPAPGARRRFSAIDPDEIRTAGRSDDPTLIFRAFRCNQEGQRGAEWSREVDGLTLYEMAAILYLAYCRKQPIREPSGFRAMRNALAGNLEPAKAALKAFLAPQQAQEATP
jgi:hypothetical protein